MLIRYRKDAPKKAVNCSLNGDLLARAKTLGVNVSAAAEAGLVKVLEQAERQRIEAETEASVAFWNDYENRFGTPADEHNEI